MRTLVLVGFAIALLGGSARADDSMRCGEWLVSVGASQGEVAHKCGAPTETHTDVEYDVNGFACYVDRWIYNRGRYEFIRTLVFRGGALVRVVDGPHGY
jgi:hypothetical protein